MTISFNKLWNCPRNIEDSKVLIVGLICTLVIFMSFTAYDAVTTAQAVQAIEVDLVLHR